MQVPSRRATVAAERRYYICSAAPTPRRLAEAVREHRGTENRLHWVLDGIVREDLSRLRRGHDDRNMAVVRHFALNLVRVGNGRRSLKRMRKPQAGTRTNSAASSALHPFFLDSLTC
jgi:predicted transposase YbfD/YdcC